MKRKRNIMTAPMVARICECDLKTIHNWVNSGKMNAFRTPGRHLRFTKADVVSFLQKYGFVVPGELLK
jgi:excisionase family DNA binding protein